MSKNPQHELILLCPIATGYWKHLIINQVLADTVQRCTSSWLAAQVRMDRANHLCLNEGVGLQGAHQD